LQLTAHDNIQVIQPSTPAQMFHVLRRQVVRPYRKPLILFTPKSLLRHPEAISPLAELAEGGFQPLLDEPGNRSADKITRLVFCSGRIYYDLVRARNENKWESIALIRLEQLYPFPDIELKALLTRYAQAMELIWVQDEPRNQGAWRFMAHHLRQYSGLPLHYAGRPESSAPATGIAGQHKVQLEAIIEAVMN
jgi:2-oxoglutarate dehydrogenase E1 component